MSKITTIIIVHFVPSTLVANSLPLAFLFSHLVFFAVGLWALHDRKSLLPVIVVSKVIAHQDAEKVFQVTVAVSQDGGIFECYEAK